LVEAVVERLAQRRPRSRRWGRPGTPAEVVLRMLALKRLKGWSFADTEREVRISLVYRKVTRVYFERVPDAKTLIRLSGVLGPEGVEAINRRLVAIAQQAGVIRGRQARLDTTVTETNIHYPRDEPLGGWRPRAHARAHADRGGHRGGGPPGPRPQPGDGPAGVGDFARGPSPRPHGPQHAGAWIPAAGRHHARGRAGRRARAAGAGRRGAAGDE